jgi:3-phosphoshikimate 1-carboxyvinyltransferase
MHADAGDRSIELLSTDVSRQFVTIAHKTGALNAAVHLPSSKSIANRALILQAMSARPINLYAIPDAGDTLLMKQALQSPGGQINLGNAGTCMRFLTAYFAAKEGCEVRLYGGERMHERPIAPLVDALRTLGADIRYEAQPGFPPLLIRGKKLSGGIVRPDASVSSQFVTAIMLIAPFLGEPLRIECAGSASYDYIRLTTKVMHDLGFDVSENGSMVNILPVPQDVRNAPAVDYKIEPDWSAAAFWFEMAALSDECSISLPGLSLNSAQGDRVISEVIKNSGVKVEAKPGEITLKKTKADPYHVGSFAFDFSHCPDLFPAVAVLCAASGMEAELTGLGNLQHKESNRLHAVTTELARLGYKAGMHDRKLHLAPGGVRHQVPPAIETYNDHRMAMAFAPLALLHDITIANPDVVNKSYPSFWNHLEDSGFTLQFA